MTTARRRLVALGVGAVVHFASLAINDVAFLIGLPLFLPPRLNPRHESISVAPRSTNAAWLGGR